MSKKDLRASLSGLRGGLPTVSDTPLPFGAALRDELEQQAEALPVAELKIENLLDNPYQHLSRPEPLDETTLNELAASIRTNGFYGSLVARPFRGRYQLAYGHRRREAARRAGLVTLPVKVMDLSDTEMARIMASENFSRENLSPMGEAQLIGYFYNEQNLSHREIADILGKGLKWVEMRVRLLEAPQSVQAMVEARPETMSHVSTIMQVQDPAVRDQLAQEVAETGLTRQQLQQRVKEIVKPVTDVALREDSETIHRSPEAILADIEATVSRESKLKATPSLAPVLMQLDVALTTLERAAKGHEWNMAERGQLSDFSRRLRLLQE